MYAVQRGYELHFQFLSQISLSPSLSLSLFFLSLSLRKNSSEIICDLFWGDILKRTAAVSQKFTWSWTTSGDADFSKVSACKCWETPTPETLKYTRCQAKCHPACLLQPHRIHAKVRVRALGNHKTFPAEYIAVSFLSAIFHLNLHLIYKWAILSKCQPYHEKMCILLHLRHRCQHFVVQISMRGLSASFKSIYSIFSAWFFIVR